VRTEPPRPALAHNVSSAGKARNSARAASARPSKRKKVGDSWCAGTSSKPARTERAGGCGGRGEEVSGLLREGGADRTEGSAGREEGASGQRKEGGAETARGRDMVMVLLAGCVKVFWWIERYREKAQGAEN
jgi:hypothetical protein